MVSRDGGVPLFFDVYQGNESDPVEFDRFIRELIKRFNDIFTACEDLTIVCDKGNNSKKNLKMVDKSPFHLMTIKFHQEICSAPRCQDTFRKNLSYVASSSIKIFYSYRHQDHWVPDARHPP